MGYPQFTQNIIVTSNISKKTQKLSGDFSAEIQNNQQAQASIYAPAGYVGKAVQIYLAYNPVAGSAGTFQIDLFEGGIYGSGLLRMTATGGSSQIFYYDHGEWNGSNVTSNPADASAIYLAQQELYFDDTNPLVANFINRSGQADGGVSKQFEIWAVLEKVGS